MEHESDDDAISKWHAQHGHQIIETETEGRGNKRTSGDHQNYRIVEISQNIVKSPGDLRRLAVSQTPLRNYRLTLV